MCHVLIIEDEALIALDLQGLLEEHGATSFDFASTEAEAVEAAKARRPDFITSDVKLRVGSGPKAVEVIRELFGPVPVVFITGTPEACICSDPSALVFGKPMKDAAITTAFRNLAPIGSHQAASQQ